MENKTVILDYPVIRGDQTISKVDVRKPKSGELRGVNLAELMQMDVQALTRVLPRITSPTLTEADVRNLDPADLFQFGAEVSGFLLPKSMKIDPEPGTTYLSA